MGFRPNGGVPLCPRGECSLRSPRELTKVVATLDEFGGSRKVKATSNSVNEPTRRFYVFPHGHTHIE